MHDPIRQSSKAVWCQRSAVVLLTVAGIAFVCVFSLWSLDIPSWLTPRSAETAGYLKKIYRAPDGTAHKYIIFVPFNLSAASRPPLLLFLNGHGENGDDGIAHLRGPLGIAIWESKARFPFVAVFPQCSSNGSWTEMNGDVARALAILDEVAREYRTDPNRVYLTGASSGGTGTWAVALSHPTRFAAIAPLCGIGGVSSQLPILVRSHLPIWSFCNSGDSPALVTAHRARYRELLALGASPLYTEIPGPGHDCWSYAYRNPAVWEWFLDQTRSKNAATQGVYTSLLPHADLAMWEQEPGGVWSVDANGDLVATNHTNTSFLTTKQAYQDFELHLEFESAAASDCKIWLKSKAIQSARTGLQFCLIPSELGSGGLCEIGGRGWIAPCDPVAQRMLYRKNWNDLRLLVKGNRVAAYLNGSKLVDIDNASLDSEKGCIALEASSGSGVRRWRHLRIREI